MPLFFPPSFGSFYSCWFFVFLRFFQSCVCKHLFFGRRIPHFFPPSLFVDLSLLFLGVAVQITELLAFLFAWRIFSSAGSGLLGCPFDCSSGGWFSGRRNFRIIMAMALLIINLKIYMIFVLPLEAVSKCVLHQCLGATVRIRNAINPWTSSKLIAKEWETSYLFSSSCWLSCYWCLRQLAYSIIPLITHWWQKTPKSTNGLWPKLRPQGCS